MRFIEEKRRASISVLQVLILLLYLAQQIVASKQTANNQAEEDAHWDKRIISGG
jgi:hypothetical protein